MKSPPADSDALRDLRRVLDLRAKLNEALGFGTKGARPRNAQAAIRELEDQQKARAKRLQRDSLDRVLTEFTSLYRDVLAVQTGSGAALVNADLTADLTAVYHWIESGAQPPPPNRRHRP